MGASTKEQLAYEARVERATADPKVADRMLRRLTAIDTLVCGRPGSQVTTTEPIFMAGMRPSPAEMNILMATTGRDGRDAVYVSFDIDDIAAEPRITLIRPQGEDVVAYKGCRLWIDLQAARAVLVAGAEEDGRFVFRTGRGFEHLDGPPSPRPGAGYIRAAARVERAETSAEAGAEAGKGRRQITRSRGPGRLEHMPAPKMDLGR